MTYFDRYMQARGPTAVLRNEAELISLTAVLVAAKFLERQSPGISDLCAVAANAHPRADFTYVATPTRARLATRRRLLFAPPRRCPCTAPPAAPPRAPVPPV